MNKAQATDALLHAAEAARDQTGVRGMGFARTDSSVPWPQDLAVKLPK